MSTWLDTEAALVVLETIEEFGKLVKFNSNPTAVYSPDSGSLSAGSPVSVNKKIIPPFPYEAKLIDGDVVRIDDLQTGVAVSGLGFVPERLRTTVVFESKVWQVVGVNPVYSGEDVAMYLLQLRLSGPEPVPEEP